VTPSDWLYLSGTGQLAFAVLQGWPIAMHGGGGWASRLFPDRKRLLQSHIDNLMMGTLQVAVAAGELPFTGWVLALILAGSWLNPQFFLLMAVQGDKFRGGKLIRTINAASFAALTIGYVALFIVTALSRL
jgi:hydroxylaminobenzene mutase